MEYFYLGFINNQLVYKIIIIYSMKTNCLIMRMPAKTVYNLLSDLLITFLWPFLPGTY